MTTFIDGRKPGHMELSALGWADEAETAEKRGDWLYAAECWETASGRTIGHCRRDRYEAAAKRCREQALKASA